MKSLLSIHLYFKLSVDANSVVGLLTSDLFRVGQYLKLSINSFIGNYKYLQNTEILLLLL